MKKLFFLLLLISHTVFAAEDYYTFQSHDQENRFHALTSQLRCLVCQNQTLDQSNAGLANDLRDQIYQKIQHGQSNQEIINYLVTRYGDFILYSPPFNFATMALWLGPFIILIFSLGYLIRYLHQKREQSL